MFICFKTSDLYLNNCMLVISDLDYAFNCCKMRDKENNFNRKENGSLVNTSVLTCKEYYLWCVNNIVINALKVPDELSCVSVIIDQKCILIFHCYFRWMASSVTVQWVTMTTSVHLTSTSVTVHHASTVESASMASTSNIFILYSHHFRPSYLHIC